MATFKSKLIKVLAMTALVFAAFSFTACGPKPGDENGSGGGSGGGDGTPQLTEAQKAKLKALNGYEITFEYNVSDEAGTENGEYTLGEKGDVSWFSTEGISMALKKTGSTIETYMGMPDEEDEDTIVWYSFGGDTADQDFDISFAEGFFAWANDYDLSDFTSAGTDTVAGRSCNKYTYTDSAYGYGEYATASWTIWIDKELDITMKFEVSGSSSNQGSSEYYYRITSFKTGNEVTLPDLENAVDKSNMSNM